MSTKPFAQYLSERTEETAPNLTADFIPMRKTSSGAVKKVKPYRLRGTTTAGDIASTANVDITAIDEADRGDRYTITGTTNIEGITIAEGEVAEVTFEDSLTLVYHATNFPLVTGGDIVTQANDTAIVVGGPGNVGYIKQYIRATGAPVHPAFADSNSSVVKFGWFGAWFQAAASAFWVVLNFNDVVTTTRQLIILMHDANRTLDLAGSLTVENDVTLNNTLVNLTPVAYADLPASPAFGMIAAVNDSTTAAITGVISGEGLEKAIVYFDGTYWRVMGGSEF